MANFTMENGQLILKTTPEDSEGFELPEGFRASRDQWQSMKQTTDLLHSKEFGCEGCELNPECEIQKAIRQAIGENYPLWPKDWLVIEWDGIGEWSEEKVRFDRPDSRILCRARKEK